MGLPQIAVYPSPADRLGYLGGDRLVSEAYGCNDATMRHPCHLATSFTFLYTLKPRKELTWPHETRDSV
jgi:hypothetical protein